VLIVEMKSNIMARWGLERLAESRRTYPMKALALKTGGDE